MSFACQLGQRTEEQTLILMGVVPCGPSREVSVLALLPAAARARGICGCVGGGVQGACCLDIVILSEGRRWILGIGVAQILNGY